MLRRAVRNEKRKMDDSMCTFCCQSEAHLFDPRKLLCGHVGCFTCIEHVLRLTGYVECGTCRFKSEVADVSTLESVNKSSLMLGKSGGAVCGLCHDKPASVFCVKCQKLLCSFHKREDHERADSTGQKLHHHVKTEYYLKNRQLYIRHYCRRHSDKKTCLACCVCLDVFCGSCDKSSPCSSTTSHTITSPPEAVTILLTKINELQAKLAEKCARCQSLLKDTYRKMEFVSETTNKMIAEVDRIMKEQIEIIIQEGDQVKMAIMQYKDESSKMTEGCAKQVLSCNEQAVEQMSYLHTITKMASPGHKLEKFRVVEGRIKDTLETNLLPVNLAQRRLVNSGRRKGLEVKLSETDSCTLEFKKTSSTESERYNSVRWVSKDCLVTAGDNGIELRDSDLNIIKTLKIPNCHDVIPYMNELIVLQRISKDNNSIQLYSMQLEKLKDIANFSSETSFSQTTVTDGKIVVSDDFNQCLHVWTYEGVPLPTLHITDMNNIGAVYTTSDGCVLVSDWGVKGCVRKYQLSGDNSLVWTSDKLKCPWGISETEYRDLYVIGDRKHDQVIYQLSPNGKLKRTLTSDQLKDLVGVNGLSIIDDRL